MAKNKKGLSDKQMHSRFNSIKQLLEKGNQRNTKGIAKILKDPSKVAAGIAIKLFQKNDDGVYIWNAGDMTLEEASKASELILDFKSGKTVDYFSKEESKYNPATLSATKPITIEDQNILLRKVEKMSNLVEVMAERLHVQDESIKGLAARVALSEGTNLQLIEKLSM